MKTARDALGQLIRAVNRQPFWRRQTRCREFVLEVPSFDRWLYAQLIAFRLMGREEFRFFSRHLKPGMTVIDIGANIGVYSLVFADLVGESGRVLAYEPSVPLFEAAIKNIHRNGREGVIAIENLALGSMTGEAVLYEAAFNSGDNRLAPPSRHRDGRKVRISSLDDALPGDVRVDWIKIDVQGWEVEVFRGMAATLKRNPAVRVYFEYWPAGLRNAAQNESKLLEVLQGLGLSVFRPDDDHPLSLGEIQRLAPGKSSTNLVAYRTEERRAQWLPVPG